jgi:50S ribosomal protein L16 3-hydroxylase
MLAGLSVEQFLRRHWQRKPLLVRGAVPELREANPLPPERLFEHAATLDVESRIVSRARSRWSVEHGPFDTVPPLKRRDWTLLVQGMDLVDESAHAMLQRFRFVPDARLDDLMVSFATPGGGVGPHVDSYDVFLLQASGRRRWSIGPAPRPQLVPGLPLRILQDWQPTETFEVEPGDLLYLPPGWGHDGVAIDACTTWSIGFRTPSRQEFLSAWLNEMAEQAGDEAGGRGDRRFGDPGRAPVLAPALIPDDLRQTLRQWVEDWRAAAQGPGPQNALDGFIGRHLSEPKAHVIFERPARELQRSKFASEAARHGVALDRRTRMLYDERQVFINGDIADLRPNQALRDLANARKWTASQSSHHLVNEKLCEFVYSGYQAGWIHLERVPG